ncbi:MAG: valine--tRNA ligase [Patescibacteria group bacterium]|jgi:valyl-tRNA synthetase
MTLPKAFEAKDYEDSIYKLWEESGAFNPDNLAADETYTIILPPPNATGTLHLGHAMYVVQDILIRYQRMHGKKTLWLPGTDHAAIATQNRVEKDLAKRTPAVTRHDLGRTKFVAEVEKFVETSRGTIRNQLRKMGFSLDWSREAFTLDDTRKAAVSELFVRMYLDNLIYRGHRIVNWCPRCQSTLADDEVEYKEEQTKFYYFKYGPVVIGTARPETKFLDKTIVVNPADERYTHLQGKTFSVPWLTGEVDAQVIADAVVDQTFGTGAMTITPAHSQEDFALAQKYNLPIVQIIDEQGNFTEAAGDLAGKNARASRAAIVEILAKKGLVDHIDENYKHNLSVCYRCGTAIEPLTKVQWFVNVDAHLPAGHAFAGQTLKQVAIQVVKDDSIKIIPDRFNSTYFHWLENLHDWCISRQLWYGHRIPAWYKDNEIKVQLETPGEGWIQDDDVLDTWFSSGMWTFSTLGFPERTKDLDTYHPTQVLETGYDILFFWVARMILITTYALGEIPFENVYLHGLVRDKQGRKMSKSLGNGIDPLAMTAKYGTDALRVALIAGTTPGNDARLYEEKIASYRNFINKIWNVSRFVLMSESIQSGDTDTITDNWFRSRIAKVVEEVTGHIEAYQLSLAAERAYDFLWHELADWYVEINKFQSNPALMRHGLETALQLLHPFVPFVTETIWQELYPSKMLMLQAWPKANGSNRDAQAEEQFNAIQDIVTQIRNMRSQYQIPYTKIFTLTQQPDCKLSNEAKTIIETLCKINIVSGNVSGTNTEIANNLYGFSLNLGDTIDIQKEKIRLQKQIDQATQYRGKLQQKLANTEYVSKVPVEILEKDKLQLQEQDTKISLLEKTLKQLN